MAVETDSLKRARKPETIKDIRLIQSIYPTNNILLEVNLLLQTEEAKDELLSFLLTNMLSSSLDFHFVLISLNRIEECRQRYF